MTVAEEVAALKAKLAARKNKPGYAESNADIEARIKALEGG